MMHQVSRKTRAMRPSPSSFQKQQKLRVLRPRGPKAPRPLVSRNILKFFFMLSVFTIAKAVGTQLKPASRIQRLRNSPIVTDAHRRRLAHRHPGRYPTSWNPFYEFPIDESCLDFLREDDRVTVLTVVTRRRLNEVTGKSETTKTVKVVSAAKDSPLEAGDEFAITAADIAAGINMFFKLEKYIGRCWAGAALSAKIPGLQAYTLYAVGTCAAWEAFKAIARGVKQWKVDQATMIATCVEKDKHMVGKELSYVQLNEVCENRYSWF